MEAPILALLTPCLCLSIQFVFGHCELGHNDKADRLSESEIAKALVTAVLTTDQFTCLQRQGDIPCNLHNRRRRLRP